MSAKGDHYIKSAGLSRQLLMKRFEKLIHRCRSRCIRHNEQYFFSAITSRRTRISNQGIDLILAQNALIGCYF